MHSGGYSEGGGWASQNFHRFLTESSIIDCAARRFQPTTYVRNPDTHPATESTQFQEPTALYVPHSRQAPHQPEPNSCAQCSSLWCFHFESIMFLDRGQRDDTGVSTLVRSYKTLRHHIHEAHLWESSAICALCEDLFCYHLAKLMLLEAGMGEIHGLKLDLGRSFMTLRTHIGEAHGGY